jgi:hypothetical protein
MFKELCGKDSFKSIILATTMWDDIDERTGSQREDELKNNYWKSMIKLGSRLVRFHNTEESAWDIVGQFTGIRQPLQLQVELVEEKKPLTETAAGLVLYDWLEGLIAQIRQLIKNIEDWLRKAPKDEKEAPALVAEEKKKLAAIQRLEQASDQRNKLRGQQKPGRFYAAAKMVMNQASRNSSPSTQSDSRNSSLADLALSRTDTQSTCCSLLDSASVQKSTESLPLELCNKRLAATITALRHARDIADAASVPGLKGATSLALTVAESIGVNFSSPCRDTCSDHSTVNEEDSRCACRRGT